MLEIYYGKRSNAGDYDVFRAKGFSPDWKITGPSSPEMELGDLPPFLRTLLVTDGTVTKSLEAYYWEPVRVDGVAQQIAEAEAAIEWLDVKAGEPVLTRSVQLRSSRVELVYAHAFSIIRHELVPADLRQKLLAGALGIGELIRSCGLETYRELLEIGMCDGVPGRREDGADDEPYVYRIYRILMSHQPAILVTEYFPVGLFEA